QQSRHCWEGRGRAWRGLTSVDSFSRERSNIGQAHGSAPAWPQGKATAGRRHWELLSCHSAAGSGSGASASSIPLAAPAVVFACFTRSLSEPSIDFIRPGNESLEIESEPSFTTLRSSPKVSLNLRIRLPRYSIVAFVPSGRVVRFPTTR